MLDIFYTDVQVAALTYHIVLWVVKVRWKWSRRDAQKQLTPTHVMRLTLGLSDSSPLRVSPDDRLTCKHPPHHAIASHIRLSRLQA
jgi:hypothetical protein